MSKKHMVLTGILVLAMVLALLPASVLAGQPDGFGVALYDQQAGLFYVKDDSTPGRADRTFRYGPRDNDWLPVAGDWNGDETYGVALYDQAGGRFFIKDDSTAGHADRTFRYGPRGNDWLPVVGDWNGDGKYGVALYDQAGGRFYIKDDSTAGHADRTFRYGPRGNDWLPVVGDWNGDGKYGVALYDQAGGLFYIKDDSTAGQADRTFRYGPRGNDWLPVAGKWFVEPEPEPETYSVSGEVTVVTMSAGAAPSGNGGPAWDTLVVDLYDSSDDKVATLDDFEDDGEYQFEGVAVGDDYYVVANMDGYIKGQSDPFKVVDEDVTGIDIELQGPVHNVTKDEYYFTIQAAIDDAGEGDEILVAAGTYEEAIETGAYTVNFTLRSVGGPDTTIINAPNPSDNVITLTRPQNVKIEGFTITGGYQGIIMHGAPQKENITIEGNIFNGLSWHGIFLFNAKNLRVIDNQFEDDVVGAAMVAENIDGAVVEENVMYAADVGIVFAGVTSGNIEILDNDVEGTQFEGIAIVGDTSTADLKIERNTVADYDRASGDLSALKIEQKPGAVNGETETLDMYNAILDDNPGVDSVELSWMKDVHNVTKDTFYDTIQAAIDDANSGDILLAYPGHYEEDVTINVPDLTLKSADGPENTVIVAQGSKTTKIAEDGVTFSGFKIVRPDSVDFHLSRGIATGKSNNIKIENNIIISFTTGITFDEGGDNVEVTGNTIEWCLSAIGSTEKMDGLEITHNYFNNNRNSIGIADDTQNITIINNNFYIEDVAAVEATFNSNARYVSNRGELKGEPAEDVIANNIFDPAARFATAGDNTTHIVPEGSGEIADER